MTKITLTDLSNLENQTSAVSAINYNNTVLETAIDNTISRDGTSPNQMNASLDMNSNHILNLPAPISADEPVRYTDIQDLTAGGSITFNSIPVGGTTGQTLTKNSSSNYDVSWKSPIILTPEMFGAVASPYHTAEGSVADSTAAFQAAIAALVTAGGGTLQLGVGVYKITTGLVINHNAIYIKGQGEQASIVLFLPSTNSSAFQFQQSPSGTTINYTGISDLSIFSSDTTHSKTAIDAIDVSAFSVSHVTVGFYPQGNLWQGSGSSTALGIRGRELGYVSDVTFYAEVPVLISPNPNSSISLDSWSFENCNFVSHLSGLGPITTNPCISVLDNTNLFNVSFFGTQNWQGGTNGFQWINTTASQASYNICFSGIKSEQCPDAVASSNAYTFFISTNNFVRGLSINNSMGGDRNGIFLRNVLNPVIKGFTFDPVIVNLRGIDVDATVGTLSLDGCNWFSTTTGGISGLNVIQSSDTPAGFSLSTAIPPKAFYSTKTLETFNNLSIKDLTSSGSPLFYSTTAVPAGGTTGAGIKIGSTFTNFGIFFGSGAPTLSAAQGSLYIRSDGSSTSTRLYINSNGTTGWTNVTTAA